jgi:hypothetical protein
MLVAGRDVLGAPALDKSRQQFGPRHPNTLLAMGNQAIMLAGQGIMAEAVPLCRQALEAMREVLGPRYALVFSIFPALQATPSSHP